MAIDSIDRTILEQIMEYRGDVCISVYLTMERKGAEIRANSVRLKNTVTEICETLEERGWRQNKIDELLAEPRRLIGHLNYWQHQHDGLALFLAPDFYQVFRLPLSFEPLTIVSNRFHIKPLLPLFSDNGVYYVLALSQKMVRLFKGSRYAIEEVASEVMEAAEIPESIDEALALDDPEEQLQHHTTTSGSAGGPEVVHHGHTVDDEKEQRIRRFLQRVAKGLSNLLKGDDTPVIVASVGYLQAMFDEISKLPTVVDEFIEGNPEHTQPEELRERAWQIVAPRFKQAREQATTRYKELAHVDQATDQLQEIVPAAVQGRVDSLFVAVNEHAWGQYSMETNDVTMHDAEENRGEDLLDYAAVQTLANGGSVYAVDEAQLPGATTIAAVLRF